MHKFKKVKKKRQNKKLTKKEKNLQCNTKKNMFVI